MKRKQPLRKIDLILILTTFAGIILFWTEVDETGYILYSSLILMALLTVARQLKDKSHTFRYSKWLVIVVTLLIVLTGIDQMAYKKLGVTAFPLVYIIYFLIQPKPAWINRP